MGGCRFVVVIAAAVVFKQVSSPGWSPAQSPKQCLNSRTLDSIPDVRSRAGHLIDCATQVSLDGGRCYLDLLERSFHNILHHSLCGTYEITIMLYVDCISVTKQTKDLKTKLKKNSEMVATRQQKNECLRVQTCNLQISPGDLIHNTVIIHNKTVL